LGLHVAARKAAVIGKKSKEKLHTGGRSKHMPTTLNALDCSVTTNSITIRFSEPVDSSTLQRSNFIVYAPPNIPTPRSLDPSAPGGDTDHTWSLPSPPTNTPSVTLTSDPKAFNKGDFVLVSISDIPGLDPTDLSAQVPFSGSKGKIVRDVEDAISYPILTEEISNRPFPVSTIPSGAGTGGGGGGSASIGQLASRAVTDVLGWKLNPADPKGFIGALTQAFTLTDVEGHVESTWNPQMPAIQTDLGGSITGAQASLYMRAKEAVDQSGSLLDTLYPLDPEADPEYVKALREMVRSQMTQIVRELAVIGLPSVLRIDTYFDILLGQNPAQTTTAEIIFNPDDVAGTLGKLRDTYGIQFAGNPFNNSVADEVVITNFRVISDYLTSVMQSWISNREFFFVLPDRPAFFGTQLVLISRQFNVIAETVNELRFTLDSVFIGPAERQALLLEFADPALPPRFLESMLIEIEAFVGDEGPRLLKEGGKITVTNNILPVVNALLNMVQEAHSPTNIDELPDGFKTARVRNSLDDLQDQLERLVELVEQVEQQVPAPEEKLSISGMVPVQIDGDLWALEMFGDGIEPGIAVTINSATALSIDQSYVTFFSAQRVDIVFNASDLGNGIHDITLTNPDGDSVTLPDAITITGVPTDPVVTVNAPFQLGAFRSSAFVGGLRAPSKSTARSAGKDNRLVRGKPSRMVGINMGGRQGPIYPGRPVSTAPAKAVPGTAPSPAVSATATPPTATVGNPVQDLSAAHAELGKKVDAQSQQIAGIHQKIDGMFEHLKNALLEHGKALQEKLEQHGKQQQEQLDEKIRQFTQPKQGK
jgi:hypothetical protein